MSAPYVFCGTAVLLTSPQDDDMGDDGQWLVMMSRDRRWRNARRPMIGSLASTPIIRPPSVSLSEDVKHVEVVLDVSHYSLMQQTACDSWATHGVGYVVWVTETYQGTSMTGKTTLTCDVDSDEV